jgi:hypothetical protein
MKKFIACLLLAAAGSALGLNAEPQIAFRLLDDYIQEKQEKNDKNRVGEGIMGILSGVIFAGCAATAWFAGDEIYSSATGGQALNQNVKAGVTVGLAAGGALFTWGGIDRLTRHTDLREQYSSVYEEKDPEVQEAMAAATLHDFYNRGRNERIGGAITKLSVAAITIALVVGGNIISGTAAWNEGIDGMLYGNVWNLSSGIGDLFKQSKEELLYEKYLAAKDTLYSRSKDEGRAFGEED